MKLPEKHSHLWIILAIALTIIGIQISIDVLMGTEAEYFNAHATVLRLLGQSPDAPVIYNESELGRWALPLAVTVLVIPPLLLAALLVKVGSWSHAHRV